LENQKYIREMSKSDLPKIKSIIDDNHMFPSEYIDEMTVNYFNQETEEM
jgi:hypothetical protein